jgi:hypothetical protein
LVANGLATELVVLTESTSLWAFVSEHRSHVEHPHRLRTVVQSVFDVRPANRSCAFGTKRYSIAAVIFERVHLFLNDVSLVANATLEEVCIFKRRSVDPVVAELVRYFASDLVNVTPVRLVFREYVGGASWAFEVHANDCLLNEGASTVLCWRHIHVLFDVAVG